MTGKADARFKVATWHGEGRTVFYVVGAHAPESEQPAVIESYSTPDATREDAERWAAFLNFYDAEVSA